MAKNFTDFEQVSGSFTPATYPDGDAGGYLTGTKTTQANRDMFVVGYNTDEPGGERRYTIGSVLLAAQASDVGLENVTNESKQHMFNNTTFTGQTTAAELFVTGDLHVEGDNVQLNTIISTTSAIDIDCAGNTPALRVKQSGNNDVAQFLYDDGQGPETAMVINQFGNIGIGVNPDINNQLTILGDMDLQGDIYVSGSVDGRDVRNDGLKLDAIETRADVTCMHLSDVSARLQFFRDRVTGYENTVVGKGFDLLEDGDTYKKIPNAMTGTGAAIGDYSVTKLKSVEHQADKTGDHSGDIILNDVPDGPWTGDSNTTYVRVTSAEHDRLNAIRGVSNTLYTGDSNADLTANDIVQVYQRNYTDFWSSANEIEYRQTIIPEINRSTTYINNTSAAFADMLNDTSTTSGDWNTSVQRLDNQEEIWNDTTTVVYQNSGTWEHTHTSMSEASGDWQESISLLAGNSATWESQNTVVKDLSAHWEDTRTFVLPLTAELTGAISNKPNLDDTPRVTEPGEAVLDNLNVMNSLTAQGVSHFSGQVMVLSGGQWKKGVDKTIDVGGDKLVFVDGILIDVIQ